MKVSTDACIQGAWTPVPDQARRALDLGAGTGLLALMLAQRAPRLQLTALELDADAAAQAAGNLSASPWASRLEAICGDARVFDAPPFDLVVVNPPFFTPSLLGPAAARNQARQTLSLSQQDLLSALERLLGPEGSASVLLPADAHRQWKSLLERSGWWLSRELHIVPRAGGAVKRVVGICQRGKPDVTETESLTVYQEEGAYTASFSRLLQPFYLNL